MTWHAKRVIMSRICAYLISKTKSVTVAFVCLCLEWCGKWHTCSLARVSHRTTRVPNDTRAFSLACDKKCRMNEKWKLPLCASCSSGQNKVKNVHFANQFLIKLVRTRRKMGLPKTTSWIKVLNVLFQFI